MAIARDQLDTPAQGVTFLIVADEAEERSVLASLDVYEDRLGGAVAPVLDQGGLLDRLRRVWDAVGLPHAEVEYAPLDELPAAPAARSRAPLAAIPELLMATPCLSPGLRALVEGIARRRVVELSEAPGSGAMPGSVLVLAAPEDMGPALIDALERLAGVTSFGVIVVDGGSDGRFAALKTLLIGRVPSAGGARIVTSAYGDADIQGAPERIFAEDARVGERLLETHSDVLVFCGHADMWDAFAGTDMIFCARASGVPPEPSSALLPCFHGGDCYRQERMGRDPRAPDGLVGLDRLPCTILALEGCHVIRLGSEPERLRHGLVYRACQSSMLGVLASVELMRVSPGVDTLLLALLMDGRPLGEVVAEVNAARRRDGGAKKPRRLGPLILFGNPCLTLDGPAPERASVEVRGGVVTLDLPADSARSPDGCVATFQLDGFDGGFVTIRDKPSSLWLQGAVTPDGRGHVWARSTSDERPIRATLELSPDDRWEPHRGCWRSMATALMGWVPMLEIMTQRARAKGDESSLFSQVAQVVPSMMDLFARATVSLSVAAGALVDEQARRAITDSMQARGAQLASVLLSSACEAFRSLGVGAILELEGREEMLDVCGPESDCSCGRGRMWTQQFTLGRADSRVRVEYQCESCAALDVDDGRRLIRISRCPTQVHGRTLDYTLACAAPAGEHVQVTYAAFLEPWLRAESMHVAEPTSAHVAAGETRELAGHVELPASPLRGLHKLAIVTVVNGALTFHRRPIRFEP